MKEERMWVLVARKLSGEATEEEVRELEDLLRTDPEMNFIIESFFRLWNAGQVKQTEEINVKNYWDV